MKLQLQRTYRADCYTIGRLSINGDYFCDTLEDTDRLLTQSMPEAEIIRRKVYGQTAIPTGDYHVDLNTVSEKFKSRTWAQPYGGKVPRLLSVPGFDGVLIHPGNTDADTYGCILVGENKVKGQVINSQATYHKLMEILQGQDVMIEVR